MVTCHLEIGKAIAPSAHENDLVTLPAHLQIQLA